MSDEKLPPLQQTLFASSTAVCVAKALTHPLDTLKAKMQVEITGNAAAASAAGKSGAGGSSSSTAPVRPGGGSIAASAPEGLIARVRTLA